MTRLPAKRERPRSGIERAPKREWSRHRKFVRSFGCSVAGCPYDSEPIEFAHIRSAANSGAGLKPHDGFGISLCAPHHREQHQIGQAEFERQYNIDLRAIAAEFARKSPDIGMRESLKLTAPVLALALLFAGCAPIPGDGSTPFPSPSLASDMAPDRGMNRGILEAARYCYAHPWGCWEYDPRYPLTCPAPGYHVGRFCLGEPR